MSNKDQDQLRNHKFDGIQEYDNDLPRWWVWLLWGTIIFSGIYFLYYYVGPGESHIATFEKEMAEVAATKKPEATGLSEEELMKLTKDPQKIMEGKAVFTTNCLSCHGEGGKGVIGPNLTDSFFIHGGKLSEMLHTINEGVLDKGMLSWKALLSEDQRISVLAYIRSIFGTNPAGAKASQGNEAKEPWMADK